MSKLLKWIVNIILLIAIIVAGGLLLPPLVGVTTVIVDDVDMETNLAKGSVTYAVEKEPKVLSVGDNILVNESEGQYVYRLKKIDAATGSAEMEDRKGAGNEAITKVFKKAVPKVVFTVPVVGYVVMAMKSTEGLIIIGLAVIFVIVLFILAELWKKDDDEEEEMLEEEEEQLSTPSTSVDMSAQIMEKVSSEIASEISSVVAEETSALELASDERAVEELIILETEVPVPETEEHKDLQETLLDEELVPEFDFEVSQAAGVPEKEQAECEMGADIEVVSEVVEEIGEVELAMPLYTAAELMEKAKAVGDEPEVLKDDEMGITLLDYSDIL